MIIASLRMKAEIHGSFIIFWNFLPSSMEFKGLSDDHCEYCSTLTIIHIN